jgi:hypothetical protein
VAAPRDHQDRAQATERRAAPEQLQVLALQGVALVRGVDGVAVLLLDAGQIRAAGRVARAAVFGSERRQSRSADVVTPAILGQAGQKSAFFLQNGRPSTVKLPRSAATAAARSIDA